ncbi:MAG: hypothetical protein CML23_26035 [Rhizobiaceae bacterium]|nr:hypothetical protein [Rhizobiaceae bacterium]
MTQPMKASILLAVDNTDAKRDLKETQRDFEATGAAALSAQPHVQRLVEATTGLSRAQTDNRNRGGDIAAYGAELDRLRGKYNPLFAVTQRYKQEVAEIRQAQRLGAISTDEMTAAISRQRQATLASIDAIKGRNTAAMMSGGLAGFNDNNARFRRQNLTYQLFDIGQTAAMGMNPAMILAQQGPQIAQLYAGQGGANAAMKDFGSVLSGATRFITPLTAGIAGLTAATVLGAKAYDDYIGSIKEVDTAASGLGLAVAGTRAEMDEAARAGATAAGISVSAARQMQAGFLRTGKIGSENYEDLIGLSRDFAATMGISASEAGDALAEMFSDPAKAAATLSQQYNLIDAETARYARNLAAQNRTAEAQAVLLDALPERLADAAEATTALGRAWQAVATGASNAMDWTGRAIDNITGGVENKSDAELRAIIAQANEPGKRDGYSLEDSISKQRIRAAAETADLNTQLERQKDAWGDLRATGEGVIDEIFDGLFSGDFDPEAILQNVASDITKFIVDMPITTPIRSSLCEE